MNAMLKSQSHSNTLNQLVGAAVSKMLSEQLADESGLIGGLGNQFIGFTAMRDHIDFATSLARCLDKLHVVHQRQRLQRQGRGK